MKTFRLIGMALLAVVMCVNFTSCSDNDESDVDSNSIVGFWKIASYDDDFFDNEEEHNSNPERIVYLEFTSSNEVHPYNAKKQYMADVWDGKTYYTISGTILEIDLNCKENYPNHKIDDLIKGSFSLSNNRVNWNYKWSSDGNNWSDESYSMVLERDKK